MLSGIAFPWFESWIQYTDNNTKLPEYQVEYLPAENDQPPRAICYVECEEDREFAIVARPTQALHRDISVGNAVDGTVIESVVLRQGTSSPSVIRTHETLDASKTKAKSTSLKFGKLTLTESASGSVLGTEALAALGEIKLTFHTGIPGISYVGLVCGREFSHIGSLNEKAKKALIAHTVQDGRSLFTSPMRKYQLFSFDSPGRPQFVMIFRYRSRNMLMAQRIIKPPTPVPSASSPPPETSSRKRKRASDGIIDLTIDQGEAARPRRMQRGRMQRRRGSSGSSVKDEKPDIRGRDEDDIVFLRFETAAGRADASARSAPSVDLSFMD